MTARRTEPAAKKRRPVKATTERTPKPKRRATAAPRRAPAARRTPPPPAPPSSTSKHVAAANAYVARVLSGQIAACKWVRLACQRHARDLQRASAGWQYVFDERRADRAGSFIELLPHIKGAKAKNGGLIRLEPWQAFIVCSLFGWVNRETGLRRFRIAYVEVPRKNGKSTLLSAISLYMLAVDGEPGAEIYSAATTRDQAKIVWLDAHRMAKKSEEFRERFGVTTPAHSILQERTSSKFEPLSADHDTLDGKNPHFACVDELHAHKTRGVYDVLETAIGARTQPLLFTITTAGSNMTGICYEVRTFLARVLEETHASETFFGVIYTIDEGDDWTSEETHRKANPNYGVSIQPETIRELCAKAMQLPSAQANFRTKHLDVWVSADEALFDVETWKKCEDADLDRADFTDEECVAGLDLASKDDIASRIDVYMREDPKTRKPLFYVFGRHYLPEAAVHDARNASYSGWELTGRIVATPGDVIDLQQIEDDLVADSSAYQIAEIAFDPWQAQQLANRLSAQGATMVEVRPSTGNFSEPTKELGVLMKERRIRHDGDPVLTWAIGNVVGHFDNKDNVYPRKQRPENKIDPVIALVMALSRWLRRIGDGPSVLETEGIRVA